MKSLRGKILRYIVLISATMSVIAVAVLCAVVYEFYNSRYAGVETVLFLDILIAVVIVLIIQTAISAFLAYRASKSIIKPINNLNLEDPKSTPIYRELSPLVERIEAQNNQIAKQMTDLRIEHENQDAMRRDFTANVSHELKTPLTSIRGYAELIKTGIAKDEDIKNFAGKIYDESQRLVTLVRDIIKVSQLDDKDIKVNFEQIDLYTVCEAVLSHLEIAAKQKNITMELNGDHIVITSAELIVEEIIFNLCDNAIKYNRLGGKVSINISQCVDGVQVTVSDTGIGISKDDIEHIFERFYRVDKSHSKEIGGTGLGLSIVKHGAKFLDASVSVESEIGVGTTVRIVF